MDDALVLEDLAAVEEDATVEPVQDSSGDDVNESAETVGAADSPSLDGLASSLDGVSGSNGVLNDTITTLDGDVRTLNDSVVLLLRTNEQAAKSEDTGEEATYVVRLDPSQVDVFRQCGRIACTEGLFIIILLALLCGLKCFELFASRWAGV